MQSPTNSVSCVNDFILDQGTCNTFLPSNRRPGCDSQGCSRPPESQIVLNRGAPCFSTGASVDNLSNTFEQLDLMSNARRELVQVRGEEETFDVRMRILWEHKLARDKCLQDNQRQLEKLHCASQRLAMFRKATFQLQSHIELFHQQHSSIERWNLEISQILISQYGRSSSRGRPHRRLWRHAEDRIVRVPNPGAGGIASHQGQIKTELCRNWQEYGNCPYTVSCRFAHGAAELRPVLRHPLYKTQFCRMIMQGRTCVYDHRCHFLHDEDWPA